MAQNLLDFYFGKKSAITGRFVKREIYCTSCTGTLIDIENPSQKFYDRYGIPCSKDCGLLLIGLFWNLLKCNRCGRKAVECKFCNILKATNIYFDDAEHFRIEHKQKWNVMGIDRELLRRPQRRMHNYIEHIPSDIFYPLTGELSYLKYGTKCNNDDEENNFRNYAKEADPDLCAENADIYQRKPRGSTASDSIKNDHMNNVMDLFYKYMIEYIPFFCALCGLQYSAMPTYELHYDHTHKCVETYLQKVEK